MRVLILLIVFYYSAANAQQDSVTKKVKSFEHSVGLTYARHTDLLSVPDLANGYFKPDNYYGYNSFKLFYELRYKKRVSLELGLSYLAVHGNYTYRYQEADVTNTIKMKIGRVFPPAFAHVKYHFGPKLKRTFVGIGVINNANFYESQTWVQRTSGQKSYWLNRSEVYKIESTDMPIIIGKEVHVKKIKFDLRVIYIKHLFFRDDNNLFGNGYQINYETSTGTKKQSSFTYDALQFGVSIIY